MSSKANMRGIQELKGLALVTIKSRHINLEFEQAVKIDDSEAVFVGLDDFGGETFRIFFNRGGMIVSVDGKLIQSKGGKLKKILSLPLDQKEFLSIIKYQIPEGYLVTKNGKEIIWEKEKKKKLRVHFSDFIKNKRGIIYPMKILIEYKKNFIDFQWFKVKLK